MDVYRTVFTVEVFSRGPYVVPEEFDALADISYAITDGPHIGWVEQTSQEIVPPADVEAHMLRIHNDGSFFEEDYQ